MGYHNIKNSDIFIQKIRLIKESLTASQIIKILTYLGADRYEERQDYIIFPTICHNLNSEDASMKLYYYFSSKVFICYTECSSSFDIFGLVQKVWKQKNLPINLPSAVEIVCNMADINSLNLYTVKKNFVTVGKYFNKKKEVAKVRVYNKNILKIFTESYPYSWIKEGISIEAMKKFNVLASIYQNKIIIPHYDIDNNLVGIRGRALGEEEIALFGKYAPIKIENIMYTHPLSLNLYGLNISKDNIKKIKTAIVFEGEKSCMKYESIFPTNCSVASCGNSFNINQLNLLLKLGVREIVIAYDKEYTEINTEKAKEYFMKLFTMCQKYRNYINISFIYDIDNLLEEKDSPIDKGKEIFEKLFNHRVILKE